MCVLLCPTQGWVTAAAVPGGSVAARPALRCLTATPVAVCSLGVRVTSVAACTAVA